MAIDSDYELLLRRTKSYNTVKVYLHALGLFFDYVISNGYDKINTQVVQDYINHISKNSSPTTVHLYSNTIRAYLRYKGISINEVYMPRIPQVEADYLDEDMLKAYFGEVKRIRKSITLKVVLFILPYTGLRINEALSLTANNIIRRNSGYLVKVYWQNAKGHKERFIPLCEPVKRILLPYARERRSGKLFDISTSAVKNKLKDIGKKIGAPWLHPHSLRHTFASTMARKGVDLRIIQKLLGHTNITATMHYVHGNISEMQNAITALDN